jgi:hypothetical protein
MANTNCSCRDEPGEITDGFLFRKLSTGMPKNQQRVVEKSGKYKKMLILERQLRENF